MSTHQATKVVLMAEDDEDDLLLVKAAFAASGLPVELRSVSDGEELIAYLFRRSKFEDPCLSPTPNLILLDLNMPKKDGREALAEIKAQSKFQQIPVVVLTTSRDTSDIQECHEMGASSFVTKPNSFQALVDVVKTIGEDWLDTVELPPYNRSIEQECGNCE
jgi:two-component system, response regulator